MHKTSPQLVVALDFPHVDQALAMAEDLASFPIWMKVGLELLTHAGPDIIADLCALGIPVFLDGKFHDIPNTVAGAVRGAVATGARMVNVHASGGVRMMHAAREAADEAAQADNLPRPLIIAVTVLTSLSAEELRDEVGISRSPEDQVVTLARLAQQAGLDGVVASAWEASAIRAACGPEFHIITPGIRPDLTAGDDQRRIATPASAIHAGADFLVVGRPITQSADPQAACAEVLAQIDRAVPAHP